MIAVFLDEVDGVGSDGVGVLRNLAKGDKVYLLKKTNGKLIATDITDTVNLPTIYGTIEGTVAEDASNNLVLTVTNAESLTDAGDSYKYIKVVEVPAENAGNTITVEASRRRTSGCGRSG